MHPARALWTRVEAIHALTYFAPEHREAFERAGLRGFWRAYFAGRAAPLGVVGPGIVTALFHGFDFDFVARAVPDVWTVIAPEQAIDLRLQAIDGAMVRLGIDAVDDAAVGLLREAVRGCDQPGRPMFAANAGLAWPTEPHLAVWHACTLLREHRGDGHVVALTAAGLDAPMAHVSRLAADGSGDDSIKPHRGLGDDRWHTAIEELQRRGWLDTHRRLTDVGRTGRDEIESETDRLASGPVDRLGDRLGEVIGQLDPLVDQIVDAGAIPFPNAMGLVPRTALDA